MNAKAIISALILCISLFFVSNAQAKPDLTPEQLAKAREVAKQMKPPVDFDALLDEADRLGVECEGDLTRKSKIWNCSNMVKTAQSKERQAKLDEESVRLDEEYKKSREETARINAETRQIASDKLNQ